MNLRERFESTSGYSSMTMDSSFLALFGEIKISSNTTVLTAILSSSSPARASTLDQNQSGVFPFINFCCSLLNLKVYMRLEGAATGITPACGATTCAVAFYNFLCVR
ncbi:uncharacterized protein [Elaeis guineensis]|uniref:uncharacterized protein isoform X7 n=1 Tax=Elaeis guineensis var. tenera TaxID=51953 RepID=UPI003C6DA452